MGPRYFSDESERWQATYPRFQCHLAKHDFYDKLVVVLPAYFKSEVQLKGRATVTYDGRNVEDVVEAIVGEPDVVDMIRSPFYPSIRSLDKSSSFVAAEKRVAQYESRFDLKQLVTIVPTNDFGF